jgi:hypothetical protein
VELPVQVLLLQELLEQELVRVQVQALVLEQVLVPLRQMLLQQLRSTS